MLVSQPVLSLWPFLWYCCLFSINFPLAFLHLLKPCRSRVVRDRHVWNASLQFMSLVLKDWKEKFGEPEIKLFLRCHRCPWRWSSQRSHRLHFLGHLEDFLRWYRHHHQWWSKWDHPAPGEKDAISRHFNDSRTWKILKESKRETKSMKEDERSTSKISTEVEALSKEWSNKRGDTTTALYRS